MTEQNINPHLLNEESENTNGITLHDLIQMVLANWYWFALSAIICLGTAYYYLASTPKIYSRTATILVKDSRKGGDTDLGAFSDLVGFQNRRNVDNEVYILQSHRLMSEVVKRLHLTVNYSVREGLRTADLYGRSPIEVDFINDNSKQKLSLEVTPLRNGKIELTDFEDKFVTRQETKRVILAEYGDTVATPVGQVVVHKTLFMDSTYLKKPITVIKNSLAATTNAYRAAVKSDVANKQASIVTISMNNSVPRRAEDVINTLIAVYEEDAIADKRQLSVVTADFIKERMQVIGRELGDVDRDIEDIKKSNKMIDITSEATRTITESTRYKAESLTIENQISVADFIREYLNDPSHAGDLIPMVASMTNNGIVAQISEYNEAILRREKLLENSSERSPVIQDLDNGLAAVRRSIIASLNSHISTLEIQLETMRKEEAQVNRRISTMPSQEKVMLDIMRQQKIKEELFLYLLNKQEETQLNYAVAESNSRTIDQAYGSPRPVSPRSMIILGISLLAGLAIPFGIIYLIGMLDTTIRGRKDVEENLSAPFLGDIPFLEGDNKGGVVVRETGRDALSEAFRILRSNMTFMNVSSGKEIKCVLFTSSDPHAGKTFVAMNLAMTLAMAGKRVVLIDLDLRRHALTTHLGRSNSKNGMSGYLAGTITDIDQLVTNMGFHENLDVICAGIQPPNPTEMLLSNRLDKLVEQLKERYDFVFIDSTPAMSVADAVITDRLADLCIYIVREGVLDRRQLPDIERLYREKKFHNMCIVLNGTRTRRHGYGYGYGYGDDHQEVSYRKRIKLFFSKLARKVKK